jgi:hypothetical protein
MIMTLVKNEEEFLKNSFEKNYPIVKHYFHYRPYIFQELVFIIAEITRCLIIESYSASITATNYMLERLLKIALAEDELEVGPITFPPQESYDRMYPYLRLDMEDTINRCCTKKLISAKEKKQLKRYKTIFRNGFSHADLDLIFKEFPDTYTAHTENKTYIFNLKKDPRQTYHLTKFAEKFALEYFDYTVKLIDTIENNLIVKYPDSWNVKNIVKHKENAL